MDPESAGKEFEKRARERGLTVSQYVRSLLTGQTPEELKADDIRASWPKPARPPTFEKPQG